MSTTPAPLNVEMNDTLAKSISEALDPEMIKSAILAEAQKQFSDSESAKATQKAEQDAAAAAQLAEAQKNQQPTSLSHTENIAGKDFIFTGTTQAEIDAQVAAAYRIAFAVQQPVQGTVEETAPDPAAIAAAAEAEAAAKIALQEQFRNGTISAEDYLEKSGAIKSYLEKEGLSVDVLKATVDQNQTAQYEKSWAQATTEFLQGSGSDWPGGDKNKEILGMRIAAMGLTDAPDKIVAMSQAWASMKKDGMYFPYQAPAATTTAPAPVATAPAPVAAPAAPATPAAPARTAATSSSLFDRSSGVTDFVQQTDKTKPAEFVVPDNATPQQIMEAYKKFVVANGQNANDAFSQAFSGKK